VHLEQVPSNEMASRGLTLNERGNAHLYLAPATSDDGAVGCRSSGRGSVLGGRLFTSSTIFA
jgi:hypothetical protein